MDKGKCQMQGSRAQGRHVQEPCSFQLQEANAQLAEQACPHDVEMTPVQRRIEPRSADDSLSGVVRCLYFADTFLRDGEAGQGEGLDGSVGHLDMGEVVAAYFQEVPKCYQVSAVC